MNEAWNGSLLYTADSIQAIYIVSNFFFNSRLRNVYLGAQKRQYLDNGKQYVLFLMLAVDTPACCFIHFLFLCELFFLGSGVTLVS